MAGYRICVPEAAIPLPATFGQFGCGYGRALRVESGGRAPPASGYRPTIRTGTHGAGSAG